MLSEKLTKAINAQINAELWSAYLYLSMSMHFANKGYSGIANWFAIQFKEEQELKTHGNHPWQLSPPLWPTNRK